VRIRIVLDVMNCHFLHIARNFEKS